VRDPTNVTVNPVPLSPEQQEWLKAAWAQVERERLVQLIVDMVNIPSPTGREGELARFLTSYMKKAGFDAFYQEIDTYSGNAIGRVRGCGDGPDLLFYGQIDNPFTGDVEKDGPGTGGWRQDLQPVAVVDDERIVGAGAENPKGHAACALMAAEAVKRSGIPLKGDVIVGLVAGGMPTDGYPNRPGETPDYVRRNIGHGVGCEFMLKHGVRADFAIVAKTGSVVAWEEPGLCWFRVDVKGLLNYAGVRHWIAYKNPIVDAAHVILALEEWFGRYARENALGTVAPQGAIGAIEAGWPDKPTFIPAVCSLYIDLRINARMDPLEAKRQFGKAIADIRSAHPELDLDWEMILSIPGGRTDPDNWIVQSCLRAWEYVEQRKHVPWRDFSGVTDWCVLQAWGIPTARLGMNPATPRPGETEYSIGRCDIANAMRLVKTYIYTIIDTCGRTREEVGIES
jgi:acetylornithine deacetylase/succinyl-diaminopimelate desuccinylase-like protein